MKNDSGFNLDPAIRQRLLETEASPAQRLIFGGKNKQGKKKAAQFLAEFKGKELLVADLSKMVSKYIGETEKNLRVLFDAAEQGESVLFFDEADALFGKRTEVKDSHDRYANSAINYLYQRIENFSGTVILSFNENRPIKKDVLDKFNSLIQFPPVPPHVD